MRDIKEIIKFVFPYWKKYWKHETLIGLILIMLLLAQLIIPIIFQRMIDSITILKQRPNFLTYFVFFNMLILSTTLISWVYKVYITWLGESLIINFTSATYLSIIHKKRSFWQKYHPNDILTRLTQDIISIKSFIIDFLHNLLLKVVMLISIISILFYMSIKAGIILLLSLPIIYLITYFGNDRLNKNAVTIRKLASSFTAIFQKALEKPFLNFSWSLFSIHESNYGNTAAMMKKEQVHFANQIELINTCLGLINVIVSSVVIILILRTDYIAGLITVGTLFAILLYAGRVTETAKNLADLVISTKINRISVLRIKEIIDHDCDQTSVINISQDKLIHPFFNDTLFDGIRLPCEDKFVFYLKTKNGSGKTTLAYILSGFDDLSGKTIDKEWFLLPSDPFIFPGTLLENIILISGKKVGEKEVLYLLEQNNLASLLTVFEHGFSSVIANESELLSRGQKQVAVFISAIVKNPNCIIIDEGLNSIDQNIKKQIKTGMFAWLKERKSIVIEHENFLCETQEMGVN